MIDNASFEPAIWRRTEEAVATHGPVVLSGLGVILGGYIAALVVRAVLRRALTALRLDSAVAGTRLASVLGAFGKEWGAARVVAQLAYWTVLLLSLDAAAGVWGLTSVQHALSAAVGYLPKVLAALAVAAVGAYAAGGAKRAVGSVLRELRNPIAGLAETVVESGVLLLVGLVTLDMLGVNLGFITQNLTLLLGALLVIAVFLGCFALRKPAEELVANYYLRRMLSVGDHVQTKALQGTVLEFVPLGLILRDATVDEHFVPARELLGGLRRRPGLAPD
jgi:Mechanosensitive ion channel